MSSPHKTALLVLVLGALAAVAGPISPAGAASTGGASAPAAGAAAAPVSGSHARVRPSGIATWFGPGFYGNKTACGQTLTPAVVGLANRKLPCGTLVRVTYAGHSVTMPVLDRGPYSHAEWDLTAGAAAALGIQDTVRIHARVVGVTANTASLGTPVAGATGQLAGGALAG
jgi:rare lipoprotein A (peptidoglycan hydrolase)